ncbi:uncharacterized protein LOC133350850 isoform X2 [Lethenteron reissneri]|uniref:uncharacterized protein LOC133350850 isoform X2 n=1 Tax=Lethenteron reissneri TaxID=7753 RepID=UPI002AB62E99|nr:uncharacterized protein LOC133350850 isoform X2 [Lethenteron reissneri]
MTDSTSLDRCIQATLSALYPPFEATAATVLEQVFSLVEEAYQGDGLRYLLEFLVPGKHLLQTVQQDSCSCFPGRLFRHEGWPLCMGEKIILQLAPLDPRLLKPRDFYLLLTPASKAVGRAGQSAIPATPVRAKPLPTQQRQQQQQQQPSPRIVVRCLDEWDRRCVQEIAVPQEDYARVFSDGWLASLNERRVGTPLENCVLASEGGPVRLAWPKVAQPQFVDCVKYAPPPAGGPVLWAADVLAGCDGRQLADSTLPTKLRLNLRSECRDSGIDCRRNSCSELSRTFTMECDDCDPDCNQNSVVSPRTNFKVDSLKSVGTDCRDSGIECRVNYKSESLASSASDCSKSSATASIAACTMKSDSSSVKEGSESPLLSGSETCSVVPNGFTPEDTALSNDAHCEFEKPEIHFMKCRELSVAHSPNNGSPTASINHDPSDPPQRPGDASCFRMPAQGSGTNNPCADAALKNNDASTGAFEDPEGDYVELVEIYNRTSAWRGPPRVDSHGRSSLTRHCGAAGKNAENGGGRAGGRLVVFREEPPKRNCEWKRDSALFERRRFYRKSYIEALQNPMDISSASDDSSVGEAEEAKDVEDDLQVAPVVELPSDSPAPCTPIARRDPVTETHFGLSDDDDFDDEQEQIERNCVEDCLQTECPSELDSTSVQVLEHKTAAASPGADSCHLSETFFPGAPEEITLVKELPVEHGDEATMPKIGSPGPGNIKEARGTSEQDEADAINGLWKDEEDGLEVIAGREAELLVRDECATDASELKAVAEPQDAEGPTVTQATDNAGSCDSVVVGESKALELDKKPPSQPACTESPRRINGMVLCVETSLLRDQDESVHQEPIGAASDAEEKRADRRQDPCDSASDRPKGDEDAAQGMAGDKGDVRSSGSPEREAASPSPGCPTEWQQVSLELLQSGVAYLTGSRDRGGRAVVVVCARNTAWLDPDCCSTQLCRLLLYLRSISRGAVREMGLTVVVDARKVHPLPALFKACTAMQETIANSLHSVLILVDREPSFKLDKSSVVQYDIVTSLKSLYKHIDPAQLPQEFEGSHPYCHEDWLTFRMKLEPFLSACRGAGVFLRSSIQTLTDSPPPKTAQEAREVAERHRKMMARVLEDSRLVVLQREGGAALARLKREDSPVTASPDYRDAMAAVTVLYSEVEELVHGLVMLSNQSLHRLGFLADFLALREETQELCRWLGVDGQLEPLSLGVPADSMDKLQEARRTFEAFAETATEKIAAGQRLLRRAEEMSISHEGFAELRALPALREELAAKLASFAQRRDAWRRTLEDTATLHEFVDKACDWAAEGVRLLSRVTLDSPEEAAPALRALQEGYSAGRGAGLTDEAFMEMREVAQGLGSDKGLQRWKFAWFKYQDTRQLLEKKMETLRKMKKASESSKKATHTDTQKTVAKVLGLDKSQPERQKIPDIGTPKPVPNSPDKATQVLPPKEPNALPLNCSEEQAFPARSGQEQSEQGVPPPLQASTPLLGRPSRMQSYLQDCRARSHSTTAASSSSCATEPAGQKQRSTHPCSAATSATSATSALCYKESLRQAAASQFKHHVSSEFHRRGSSASSCSSSSSHRSKPAAGGSVSSSKSYHGEPAERLFSSPSPSDSPFSPLCSPLSSPPQHGHPKLCHTSSASSCRSEPAPSPQPWPRPLRQPAQRTPAAGAAAPPHRERRESSASLGCASPDGAGTSPAFHQRSGSEPARRSGNTGVYIKGLEVCGDAAAAAVAEERGVALAGPPHAALAKVRSLPDGPTFYGSAADVRLRSSGKLGHVVAEMVSTEREYVRSLAYVEESYFPELERPDTPQDLRGQRSVIFGNLEKLHDFHARYFLRELEQCFSHPLRVSHCFLRYEKQFEMYALYSKNKPQSDALLASHGNAFFKRKQLEMGDKMDLASYLLKPIQRMSKYALLLRDLIKECSSLAGVPPDGGVLPRAASPTSSSPPPSPLPGAAVPGYALEQELSELRAALELVRFQLRHGNDLLAMDALRDCDVNLKEQGQLMRQDSLVVLSGRRRYLRHVFLFQEMVLFSKTKRVEGGYDVYVYKNSYKTADIGMTENVGDSGLRFEIWFRRRKSNETFILQAPSSEVKLAWTEDISKILWQQALRNRHIRMQELVSMGIGNKPFLDIKPSDAAINDRAIDYIMKDRGAARTRASIAVSSFDHSQPFKRPHSTISSSSSSSSSGRSQSSSSLLGPLNLHVCGAAGAIPFSPRGTGGGSPAGGGAAAGGGGRPYDVGGRIEELDELEYESGSQPSMTTESSESSQCTSRESGCDYGSPDTAPVPAETPAGTRLSPSPSLSPSSVPSVASSVCSSTSRTSDVSLLGPSEAPDGAFTVAPVSERH